MSINLKKLEEQLKSNIESDTILKETIDIINKYNSDDWKEYCCFCNESYKRNLVFRNEQFEILILCWEKGQKSEIHNHPKNGCVLKILSGELLENVFDIQNDKLSLTKESTLKKDDISYMEGSNGLHSIEAIHNTVSLHVYSPPNYSPKFFY
tara:strand:- start:6212 stop:6667 length:456 start_codon:yes stop_codon:yes gene_type:complete